MTPFWLCQKINARILAIFGYFRPLNVKFSRQPHRVTTHFKAYQILNVAYCFLFVISSTVQKIWTKTYVNTAFFGFSAIFGLWTQNF